MHKPYTTYSQVPLSHVLAMLESQSLLGSLESDVVEPLLAQHLTWRAASSVDGSAIDSTDFSSKSKSSDGGEAPLEVTIASREVKPLMAAGSDTFPSLGEWKVHDVKVM